MPKGVSPTRCEHCRRRFGGVWSFQLHQDRDRCRTARELRRLGLHRRDDRIWSREGKSTGPVQLRLFPQGRPWRVENRPPQCYIVRAGFTPLGPSRNKGRGTEDGAPDRQTCLVEAA